MNWLARFWNRILTASAGAGGTPEFFPHEDLTPPARTVEPQSDRDPKHDDIHTWKAHGGYRH